MKINRSSKCSIKFSTQYKQKQLHSILEEYGKVVNIFIDHFWDNPTKKTELLKPIVDLPIEQTWLSARLRKVAAREAIDMILATKERWKSEPKKMVKPKHKGRRMYVFCTIADLQEPKQADGFDGWLHLTSIGEKVKLDIPIKFHKHYNRLCFKGKRLNSYIITNKEVQFVFEVETGKKKEVKHCIGIDTGINALASTSDREQYGTDIKECVERVKRCKQGSKGQQKARRALKQRIDETAKEVVKEADLIVVEKLKNLNKKTKAKRLLAKNIRRSIGTWNWKYWLVRLEQRCEDNRVSFRSVSPYYTSQTCPCCGHVDRKNRSGEIFQCQACGHTDNADINAARNILERFFTGPYGASYKPKDLCNV